MHARSALLAVLVATPLVAQPRRTPAILSYPANVRSAGLAGAGVAMTGYAGSVFNNPSGLAPIRALSLEGTIARLPDRSTYTMGSAAIRLASFNLGGGYQYLRFPSGGPIYDNLTWVGTGVFRRGGLALGTSGKYVSLEDSAGVISRAMTTDMGVTVALFDIAALAVSVHNLGDWEVSNGGLDLPRSWHLGFSFNLLDTYSNGRLLATIETVWAQRQERRTVLGLEAGAVFYGIGVVGRVGHGGQAGDISGTLSKTTFGGTIVLGEARVDYAYQRRSPLGRNVHLFGVRWTP
ncbi:MAG: hypothetical protein ACKVZ0_08525 [Gemmatimonadales bacterium]